MGYSTPYIVLNIILIVLSVLSFTFKTKLSHKILAILSMVVFVVFFGFRGYVQTDTLNYYTLYGNIPNILEGIPYDSHFDTGFLIYMSLIKSLGFCYDQFILISSVIDLILLTILFRQYFSYKYYALYIYLFIIFTGLEYEFNLMRNIKSVLIFLISIKHIYSRDFGKFLILNLIGISFHWSSIVFFPLYFILHKEISLKSLCIIFFIGITIYVLMPYLLNPLLRFLADNFQGYRFAEKIDLYLDINRYASGKIFSLIDIVTVIWYAIILITYNQVRKTTPEIVCFINLFVMYFIFCCMSSGMVLFKQRVAILFEPTCWLLFIWLINSQKRVIKAIIFSILVVFGMLLLYRKTKDDVLFQYDNFILSERIIPVEVRSDIYNKIKLEINNN